jgi:hypothetical protein
LLMSKTPSVNKLVNNCSIKIATTFSNSTIQIEFLVLSIRMITNCWIANVSFWWMFTNLDIIWLVGSQSERLAKGQSRIFFYQAKISSYSILVFYDCKSLISNKVYSLEERLGRQIWERSVRKTNKVSTFRDFHICIWRNE